MPGQQGTERRRLSGQVVVRLAPATAARVAARATAAGLTQAAWVRHQLVGLLGPTRWRWFLSEPGVRRERPRPHMS